MKILFLGYGPKKTKLHRYLRAYGHDVRHHEDPIATNGRLSLHDGFLDEFDLAISFGYRHILTREQIKILPRPPINLHIGLLPEFRGAHPVFWALFNNAIPGVTIHEIDDGIDTGPIICRGVIGKIKGDLDQPQPPAAHTLSVVHAHALVAVENLFIKLMVPILAHDYPRQPQPISATAKTYKVSDLPPWEGGWDLTIDQIKARIYDRGANGKAPE